MKTSMLHTMILLGASLLAVTAGQAASTALKFSDPSKPGQLIIQVGMGDVAVIGADTDEVKITSEDDVARDRSQPRPDGLRRLDGDGGFSVSEANNEITITFSNVLMGGRHRGGDNADVEITVPRQTKVRLERIGPGDTEVRNITGDFEVRGAIGDVTLTDLSGGAVIESVNGDVDANFTTLTADHPISINVVHGDVELRVPADTQANVSLRTLRGEMLTDFSEDELKTSFDSSGGLEDEEATARAEADRERAEADRERAAADRERALAEVEKLRKNGNFSGPIPPIPPLPPIPPMPPMAGGKLVAGALNGGGTSLTITTITGDITLRKAE